jgi:hypothetical protein
MRHASKWLIVVIDADNETVARRLDQLAEKLKASDDERVKKCRVEREQIARLVPKWSVETWILCLNGEAVDEQTRYKTRNRDWDGGITPAAVEFDNWQRNPQNLPDRFVPSLQHGIEELRRLTL